MSNTQSEFEDEDGIVAPLPVEHGARKVQRPDFSTGPEVGTRLPDIVLEDQNGRIVDLHADRKNSRAAVVFFRSAVW